MSSTVEGESEGVALPAGRWAAWVFAGAIGGRLVCIPIVVWLGVALVAFDLPLRVATGTSRWPGEVLVQPGFDWARFAGFAAIAVISAAIGVVVVATALRIARDPAHLPSAGRQVLVRSVVVADVLIAMVAFVLIDLELADPCRSVRYATCADPYPAKIITLCTTIAVAALVGAVAGALMLRCLPGEAARRRWVAPILVCMVSFGAAAADQGLGLDPSYAYVRTYMDIPGLGTRAFGTPPFAQGFRLLGSQAALYVDSAGYTTCTADGVCVAVADADTVVPGHMWTSLALNQVVLVSTDAGRSWTPWLLPGGARTYLVVLPVGGVGTGSMYGCPETAGSARCESGITVVVPPSGVPRAELGKGPLVPSFFVSCPRLDWCATLPSGPGAVAGDLAVSTDQGAHWSATALPVPADAAALGVEPYGLACPSAGHCVVSFSVGTKAFQAAQGSHATATAPLSTGVLFAATFDGGRSWSFAEPRAALGASAAGPVSCAGDATCFSTVHGGPYTIRNALTSPRTLLTSTDGGRAWSAYGRPAPWSAATLENVVCTGPSYCTAYVGDHAKAPMVGRVAQYVSTDHGDTWAPAPSAGAHLVPACTASGVCVRMSPEAGTLFEYWSPATKRWTPAAIRPIRSLRVPG